MNRDSRLSVALHVLLHMSEMRSAVTSEALGSMMNTNPVVIRRTLGGLRDAGVVAAEKGHGGGWTLARDLGWSPEQRHPEAERKVGIVHARLHC